MRGMALSDLKPRRLDIPFFDVYAAVFISRNVFRRHISF